MSLPLHRGRSSWSRSSPRRGWHVATRFLSSLFYCHEHSSCLLSFQSPPRRSSQPLPHMWPFLWHGGLSGDDPHRSSPERAPRSGSLSHRRPYPRFAHSHAPDWPPDRLCQREALPLRVSKHATGPQIASSTRSSPCVLGQESYPPSAAASSTSP
jgi:hypothetical protein